LYQGDFRECPVPASSIFPKLPTDTVGKLPSDQSSEKIQKLFDVAKRSAKIPIRFTLLRGLNNTSGVEATKEEFVVGLRANLDSEQKENAIAHELFHIILQSEGFAALVHTPDGSPAALTMLGQAITSCVDDAVVDRRMRKLGFTPEVLNHDSAEQMRTNPPIFPGEGLKDPVLRDGNALLIVCYTFRLKSGDDEIESSWKKLSPEVLARSQVLAKQIGDISCDKAQECLNQKKHIRDVLGYPIKFCNPLTGCFE
jgi:hypothetical protein